MHNHLRTFSLTIVAAILLSSAALLNEFPLIFSDSGTYIHYSVKKGIPVDRPVFYSWMIAAFSLNNKLPVFSIIASQALITSIVLLITLRCLDLTKNNLKLIIVILLTVTTCLPWFVGQIMPDFLLGIGLLSAYVLIYHYHNLNYLERIFLIAIYIASTLVHYSNPPVLLSTLSIILILNHLSRTREIAVIKSATYRIFALVLITLVVLSLSHLHTNDKTQQSPTAHFLMDRLTGDGIIKKLLVEHCDDNNYILCAYKDDFKAPYLWAGKSSPFVLIGGFGSPAEESWKMIIDSIKYYPLDNILSAIRVTAKQLFSFNTGEGLRIYKEKEYVNRQIKNIYSSEHINFTNSKQQQGNLKDILSTVIPIHNTVVTASFLILLFSLLYKSKQTKPTLHLTIVVLSALISNAAICGTFSGAYDRYQSRIIWLLPFLATVIILILNKAQDNKLKTELSLPGRHQPK